MWQREDLRTLVSLAWPASLGSVLFAAMEVTDAAMLGIAGPATVAGAVLAGTLSYLVIILPASLLRAAAPMAAAASGSGDRRRLRDLARLTAGAALGLGALGSLGALAVVPLAPGLVADSALVAPLVAYLAWRAPFLVFDLLLAGAWALSDGLGRTRLTLGAAAVSVGVNVVLNLVFIPGWGPVPAMGAAGAALASGLAVLSGLVVLAPGWVRLMARPAGAVRRAPLDALAPPAPAGGDPPALVARLLDIGLPLGAAALLDAAIAVLLGLWVARAGATASAAYALLGTLLALGLACATGTGTSILTLVGRAVGSGDRGRARRRASLALAVQALVGAAVVGLFLGGAPSWLPLAAADAEVAAVIAELFPVWLAVLWLRGLVVVASGALEGLGRTRGLLAVSLGFDLGLWLPVALWATPHWGLPGLYLPWLVTESLKVLVLVGALAAAMGERPLAEPLAAPLPQGIPLRWRLAFVALPEAPRSPWAAPGAPSRPTATLRRAFAAAHAYWATPVPAG